MYKRTAELVVISDVHLGTYGCHAKELAQYLRRIHPRRLILNGDFIDAWQFKKSYFPKAHMEVIHEIIRLAAEGVKVDYVTGNHDDILRRFSEFHSGTISLVDKLVFEMDGQTYWVFHGDVFDLSVKISPFIAKLGGKGYDLLIRLNRFINSIRTYLGKPYMSFAGKIKTRVKKAVRFVSDFEETAIQLAMEQNYDYVICGHIHIPQIRQVSNSEGEVHYLNSGDWVENRTALEYHRGEWSLYRFNALDYEAVNSKLQVKVPKETNGEVILEKKQVVSVLHY